MFWALPQHSFAAALPDSTAAANQHQPLEVRQINPEKLKSLQESEDFKYYQDVRPDLTAWERFWRKVGQWLNSLLGSSKEDTSDSNWNYVTYIFLIGITVFVIIKLLQIDFVGLFGRKTSKVVIPYETYTEDIHELNFQSLIEEAETQGDYRRAIRLYYLNMLKVLTDLELIKWTPSKTNRTYVTELQNNPLQRPFAHITQLFEYVWYGGSALNEESFAAVRQSIQEFNRSIKAKA